MNATIESPSQTSAKLVFERRSSEKLLSPLEELSHRSDHLIGMNASDRKASRPAVPRYLYLGERGGGDVIRLGIFATLHGDEPEGALALGRLIKLLEKDPEIARGYALFLYPL